MERALCPVLVGRERELSLLEDALLDALRGNGQFVVVAGDAGVGKTRLVTELQQRARRAGAVVIWGTNSEAELSLPYLPFLEAIGNYLTTIDIERLKLRLGPATCRQLGQLLPQLELQTTLIEAGDPAQAKMRLFEAILSLLRIASEGELRSERAPHSDPPPRAAEYDSSAGGGGRLRRQPGTETLATGLLLVVEDLHWADASTRELLEYLTRRLRRTRILILCTYRSDELSRRHPLRPVIQGWQRAGTAQLLKLDALPPAGVAAMVTAIFNGASVGPELRDFLYARSEGNPFILEEILKAALDHGDIWQSGSGWDRKAIHELKVPPTIKDNILLRVERLSDVEADILRAASVLGRAFDYETLVEVSGHPEASVLSALRAFVQQHQLMEEEPAPVKPVRANPTPTPSPGSGGGTASRAGEGGTVRYRFRHALTREAILDDLIAPEQERLHARAAEVLRRRPDADVVDLAFHLMAAGQWEEAVPMALRAAQEAEADNAYADAAVRYEHIVEHVSDRCQRAEVLSRLGTAHFFAGQTRRGQRYLQEGIQLLDECGEARAAAGYRLWLGRCHWLQARPDLARKEYEAAKAALEPFGPSQDLAYAYVRLAGLDTFDFENERGLALAQEACRVAEAAGADAARIWSYNFIGENLASLGRPDEGLQWLDRSFREAAELGYDWIAENALYNVTSDYLHYCRAREAEERVRWMREYSRHAGSAANLQLEAFITMRARGEPERARVLLEAALAHSEEIGEALMVGRSRSFLAYVYTALNRLEDARRVFASQPASPERGEVMEHLYTSIAIHLSAGEFEAARGNAEEFFRRLTQAAKQWSEIYLIDRSVAAFVRAGDVPGARRLLEAAQTDRFEDHPLLWRARGRLLLGEGKAEQARPLVERAARFLQEADYLDEAWPSRRLLARVLATLGDRAAAEAELRAVLTAATANTHLREARLAREQLLELDVEVPEVAVPTAASVAPEVRQLTERLVTVLFVDVRGYTSLSTQTAPHLLADQVSTFYRSAEEEIRRHQGLVDRYAGDAMMATFNVTEGRLDHPVQALEAALGIRDKAVFAGLPVGVGMAVGPAVVGQFSEGSRVTAVGETINLAARLQAEARAGEVLLNEEAYRRTREWLTEQGVPAVEETLSLKGFARPLTAYRVKAHTIAGVNPGG